MTKFRLEILGLKYVIHVHLVERGKRISPSEPAAQIWWRSSFRTQLQVWVFLNQICDQSTENIAFEIHFSECLEMVLLN